MAEQMISDIKVLDLSWHIAGPHCTKIMAGYGADVLKIERPGVGDPTRSKPPFLNDEPHLEKSIFFHHNNLNKRSITLNLKSETGKEIVKRLVADVDVLVENFSPGVMDRLGLGYDVLSEVNPRLVMTSISNFGSTGPYKDFKASNLVLAGMGKSMYSNGMDGREPVMGQAREANVYQCGYMSCVATLAALWHVRENGGEAQQLDLSMQEMLTVDTNYITVDLLTWAYRGYVSSPRRDPRATGTSILPAGGFAASDGFVEISGTGAVPARFRDFALAQPGLRELGEFLSSFEDYRAGIYDMENRGMVDAHWIPWCMEHTKQEIMEAAQAMKVFCTTIKTPKEVLDDPQFDFKNYWVEVDHPVVGKQIHCGSPIDIYEAPWAVTRPVPLLGQHNEEVYIDQLGYTQQDLARWKEEGVI